MIRASENGVVRLHTSQTPCNDALAALMHAIRRSFEVAALVVTSQLANAQLGDRLVSSKESDMAKAPSNFFDTSKQTAHILGLDYIIGELESIGARRSCKMSASLEELVTRQELLESVQKITLDVDRVPAEIANEQGQLANLRTSLKSRCDRTLARLNAAALITASGASVAVSATQFTNLGERTNNIGDESVSGPGLSQRFLDRCHSQGEWSEWKGRRNSELACSSFR